MRLNEVTRALGSGVGVYVIVAACSATGGGGNQQAANSGGTRSEKEDASLSSGVGGAIGTGGAVAELDAMADALADVLADPVPDAAADPKTSGTRLRARYYVGEDGSRELLFGWYDSQRDENCSFSMAADGKIRCMPTANVTIATYYKDSGCTQQVGIALKSSCPTGKRYGATVGSVKCAATYDYTYYDVTLTTTATLYSGTPAACTAISTLLEQYDVFTIGSAIPASSFVAAIEEVE